MKDKRLFWIILLIVLNFALLLLINVSNAHAEDIDKGSIKTLWFKCKQPTHAGERGGVRIQSTTSPVNYLIIKGQKDSNFGYQYNVVMYSKALFRHGWINPGNDEPGTFSIAVMNDSVHQYMGTQSLFEIGYYIAGATYNNTDAKLDTATIIKKAIDGTIKDDPNYDPDDSQDFDEKEAKKNMNLGYVKQLRYQQVTYASSGSTGNKHTIYGHRLTWATDESSTGVDLSTCSVQIDANYYKYIYDGLFNTKDVSEVYNKGNYIEYKKMSADIGKIEITSKDYNNPTNPLYSQQDAVSSYKPLKGSKYFIIMRIRILKKNDSGDWEYGPWLTQDMDSKGTLTTSDEDGNTEQTPSDKVTQDKDGNETTTTDINISDTGGLDTFISILTSIKGSIGQVPQLISEFFSFLPVNIVALIGGGFAVVILLRILGR